MQLANNLVISSMPTLLVKQGAKPHWTREWVGIFITACSGIALLVAMVNYNLKHVPSSEVDRIYKNAGSAVKRSFQLK